VHVGDAIEVISWGDGTCARTPQEALDEIAEVRAAEKQANCARRPDKGITFSIVTCSDTRSLANDTAGAALEELIAADGGTVAGRVVCRDDREAIASAIVAACDEQHADVVLTCGGSGLSLRDVTPEATADVCEREVPGIAEAMRAYSMRITGRAMLSRARCMQRGRALVVNFPGSEKAARENWAGIHEQFEHAVKMMAGGGH